MYTFKIYCQFHTLHQPEQPKPTKQSGTGIHLMDRYRDIIDNWDTFQDCITTPQPTDIRVNTLKSTKSEVKEALDEAGIGYTDLDWHPNFLRLETDKPGNTLPHWLGWYYVQESVSGIPPTVLEPQPGDNVLDICAAPGSKTTQMAAMMDNKGAIVANDVNENRIQGLAANMYRTGCLNVASQSKDGRHLSTDNTYDNVLVDAPCSAEGNCRDKEYLRGGAPLERIKDLSALQEDLLDHAIDCTEPGGTIVYSTCTLAPEENEAVVASVLERDDVEISPVSFSFPHQNGITAWNDKDFPASLTGTKRIYPHHLDSGGMYVARLTKEAT